jgi:hypothetical protein
VAAIQAAIPVARLSETEGSSNAVGGLEISAAIVISRIRRRLRRQLSLAPNRPNVFGPKRRLCPCQFCPYSGVQREARGIGSLGSCVGRAPRLQRMTSLYHGSLAHQKSSGEGRHLAPLFREQRPHFGHAGFL